jgi:hypothetical protein
LARQGSEKRAAATSFAAGTYAARKSLISLGQLFASKKL